MQKLHTSLIYKMVLVLVALTLAAPTGLFGGSRQVVRATGTGFLSPTANYVYTTGFTNPNNAHANGGGVASRENNANGVAHVYRDYNFPTIPTGAVVQGIEVRLDWYLDSTSSTNEIRVYLSWNGGTNWTSYLAANDESTNTSNTETVGSTTNTWGRTWSASDFTNANFRVRLELSTGSTSRDFYIDWVPVQITYNFTPNAPTTLRTNGLTNPTGVTTRNPVFSWTFSDPDTGDAQSAYRIQVSTSSGFGTTVWDSGQVSSSSASVTYGGTALPRDGTTYYWRVMTWDNSGASNNSSAWSANAQFTMSTNQRPNTPVNSAPATGATVNTANPTFTWSAFSDPDTGDVQTRFYLQIRQNPGSYFYRSVTPNGSGNSYISNWNLADGAYCWQVRVYDDSGVTLTEASALSTESCFTIDTNLPPTAPALVDPPDGEVVVTGQPTLDWNASTDPNGDTISYDVSIDGGAWVNVGTATTYTPGATLSNGTHTWQVRACDTHSACSTSVTWNFTVNTNIIAPNQDSYTDQANANSNYGTSTSMYVRSYRTMMGVGQNRRMYLRFNLPAITTCYAGTSPSIVGATLRVYADSAPSAMRTYQVQRVTEAWTEGSITWNNQPDTTGSATDATNVNATGWVAWNVTADVQGFADYGGSEANYGWMILDGNESESWSTAYETRFRSKEYSGSSYDPQLLISYNCPPSIPALVSPANNTYISDNTPLLDWSAATDPDGDTLRYSVRVDDGDWTSPSPDTLTEITWSTLGEIQHTWQVRAYDGRAYRSSDLWSFTVDTDVPAMPATLSEGDPDQDFYPDTAYNLLINWASVADTGSGIRYEVYRSTDGGVTFPTLVYSNTGTSFTDSGTFADNTYLFYRVRTRTGAGLYSADWTTSDGVRIDADNPAVVTNVGEGIAVGTDDDWSRDNAYYVYWTLVADTGSGISYEVQRSVNGGAYATFIPSGLTCDATRCWGDDPVGHSNSNIVRYQVRALNGAGRTNSWSTPSDGITIDLSLPDSSVTTSGVYKPATWPGSINGAASDPGSSGVVVVDIRVRDANTGNYWNGTAWVALETWIAATYTTGSWTYSFPAANLTDGHTYVVDSRATDRAGNVQTAFGNNNFTFSSSAPDAPVPTSTSHPNPAVWYNNNQPSFVWNVPASTILVQGYSIVLDQFPGTIPDTIQDTTETSYDAATTADGIWYFHVRAQNTALTWGPAGHVRVNIDTATPQTPASVTEENPDVDWDADGGVTVYWSAVPNTGSGVTYELQRSVNGGAYAFVISTTATSYVHNPGGYSDGTTVRYQVHAVNGVGLAGGWAASDGMTIDSQSPAAPAWVYEDATAEPDRDYHSQANGAVTLHWAAVADTGSGMTYRLEKRIGAGTWTLVAQNLSVTSYADSGSYSDGDIITYRVTAVNGVGLVGSSTSSDGFTVDLNIPAQSTWLREGVATDPDWDYDGDGAFTVYWNPVADTGSGIGYKLEKSVDGSDWQTVVEGTTATSYADTNAAAADGAFIRYRVTATNGAGSSGSYRLSDGITLDRESPAAPAWIYENNPDVDFDTDGTVLVTWAAVVNTGSGITYDLQKRVNGGNWTDVATGLGVTSLSDSGTYADNDLIEYHVIARNGVGYSSSWMPSDGVRVDTDTPAQVPGVGEGLVVGTDLDYVNANAFYVFWTGVSATAAGDTMTYRIERNVNSAGWSVAVSGLTATSWDDPQAYSNGDRVLYQVTAINGAGTAGAVSAASDGVTVDTGQPNSTIATTGYYNAVNWPDRIDGGASDDYSGVARVEIVIYDNNANLWWNGSAWAAGGPFWLQTPNTTWNYVLADSVLTDGHAYDLQSRATDAAGNVEASYGTNSFIFASSGPAAPSISSSTHPVQTTWYNANDLAFTWTTPSGPAPIVGYSYLLDQNSATTPDAVHDTTGNTVSYGDQADGTWYFHVRALDSAGIWGPAGHFAVHIDTTTPAAPTSVTDENPDVDYDYNGSVTVYWTAVPNTGSGIVYVVERQVELTGTWTILSDTVQNTYYLDSATGYTDGTFIRYRVSARNGVGLTGATTNSDGFTVDSDAPVTPAWVTENAADPNDQDYDPDGSVTVYWAASNDTGSGLTYRLERRITVNNLPGAWVQIASGLAGTSYVDPRANQDGETIHYRVTAVNGVNNMSTARMSDGITIDTGIPAAPAEVTENSPDIDWSLTGSVTVFWGGVADTGSGITYRLEKQVNSGTWDVVVGAEALTGGVTSFADSGTYNDGDVIRYRVRATNGAGTSGTWRESDGMTIDSSTVAAPGWVREENPDVDYDADGALTVYWAAVTDTGSGITYRLEKELNNTGTWVVLAPALTGSSYYDGQTQGDGVIVHYRVTAINGVNTASPATTSDGVTVDTQMPIAPTALGEGDIVGIDDAFDQDNTFFVYWNTVPNTGSGIVYDIQKALNGGTWVAAASAVTGGSWDDPTSYSNGDTVQYRVRAVNGAGLEGAWSAASSGITLDFVNPDSSVTTHGYYSAFNWPGLILGAASDTGSDVSVVHMTIQRASDSNYWNGSAWQTAEVWLTAAGTINWQYTFAPTDGETYDVRSRATDYAGNVENTYGVGNFTYSSSGPQAPVISSSTHPNEATWYNNNSPAFNWTEPTSAAPVVGYSYLLDQNAGTTPDAVWDTTARTASYTSLADGVWYFHVRALDNAGNWGPADHFAVRIDTATPAVPGQPTEESPDVDFDADGSFTVYWTPVANTGSGISYRLERELDNSGTWTLVITTTTTSYAYSGSHADGTFIRFRVRAVNGVGATGAWSVTSDGVTIDSQAPAAPGYVREGVATDPDWDWDADGSYTVYWGSVTDTGSGIQYRLYRRINGGAWLLLTTTTDGSYADSGTYSDGTLIEYQVIAVNGAGLTSLAATSDGIHIDSDVPATSASITEGSPDVDWDYDGVFTVYWSGVADTGSGITYRLERNLAGAGWATIYTGSGTSYADNIGNTDGTTALYRVTAINGVGTEGTARVSDGITVDSQAVPQPGWVREDSATDPDRDYHPNADGAITVYWASVTDTGSGSRYRLEKRINGGAWTVVASNLLVTSYPDSGTYADNDLVEYRVTAVNGVLTESLPRVSDGMRIDTQTPAAPTAVGEGDAAGTDDDFDQDNVYYVYWTASADTGSGLTYIVQRSRNGGSWEQAATGQSCTTTPCQWDDPVPYSNGDTVQYRIVTVNGAGLQSAASTASDGLTLDFAQPDSAVATNGYYNQFNWPGIVRGTAADALSDVAFVDVTIYDGDTARYWDGDSWEIAVTWLRAVGTLSWQYPLVSGNLTEGHTYSVNSRATDYAGNVEGTYGANQFTYASQGPQAPVISSSTHPVQTTWYNQNDPAFTWTTPSSVAPVDGYSYLLDQTPTSMPDAVPDTTGLTMAYTDQADGTWYFHVRAHDNAGNWGPAGHYRINIDTATPAAPAAVTEQSPDVDWDADGSVTVYWNAVANTGSGITYALERCVNGGLSGTCTSSWTSVATGLAVAQYADSVGATDGTTVRYRVRATNGVGLTGAWMESDGLTVDSGIPGSPAPVTEGSPDLSYDADGSFTVYWNAVTDTGSGLTYRLERRINGGSYALVAENLTVVNYTVSGTYSDGDGVYYRVTAINGVGTAGTSVESNGVIIDNQMPAAPTSVTEESPDVDWDVDGNVTVYWTAVANTGSGITYRLEYRINGGTWTLVTGADALAGTSFLVTGTYADNDLIEFRVRATNGVGLIGAWTQSNGVRVDNTVPGTPGSITENSPDVDFLANANGALTLYWTAVANTGSGITYRVERELNSSGAWTLVGSTTGTSLTDSGGPYVDDTFIRYRVTAINGVSTAGTVGLSDGVRIDLSTPAAPINVGEGDIVGTDDDYDQDNTFYVYWTAVSTTATGDTITYIVQRNRNGGAWEEADRVTTTSWEDPLGYSNNDFVTYRIIAINGAGTQGAASSPSDGLRLDFAAPDSAVTTNGSYNAFTWPGRIWGTASDAPSGIAFVDITIQDTGTSQYWNGSAWIATATWLRATGTTAWEYVFAPTDGHSYALQSRATDVAGNVEGAPLGFGQFTYAASGPDAPVISSSSHPVQTTWYNNAAPVFSWTTPASGAGIQGYSYSFDQSPGTSPDTSLDTSENSTSFAGVTDGTWYFHIRAQDNAGNWSSAAHYRVNIDTTAPAATTAVTEGTPDVDWDADGNIVVAWAAVTDLSGVTYTLERSINGAAYVQVATAIAGTSYPDFSTATDGATVRYRVRATNGVAMSGAWTESDGMTIDSIAPASPTPVTENTPDIDWSVNGTVTVYWTAVADTGSGITYRLERQVNTGAWISVTTQSGNTYADSGTYNDSDFIHYRVTAISGVGLASVAATSDGMTIDSIAPAMPASVTEESPDVDWDVDGVVTVTWSAVANTGSGITYRLERQVNGAGYSIVAQGLTVLNYADSGTYNDGDVIQYRVIAVNGVGLESTPRASDGVTVDSSIPGTPGSVTENTPDIDFYQTADGAITVYWTAVANTGSGVTYRLERQVNGGGWTVVASGIAVTSYADSGAYADDDFIMYRVTAISGVGVEGAAGTSDGMRIDLTNPAVPTNVGEGDVAGTDDDFDQDNTWWVYWDAVAPTATGDSIAYTVQRQLNGGSWETAITGLACTTTPCQWEDNRAFSDNDVVRYRVLALNSAGRSSAASVESDGIALDLTQPNSTVTTNGSYNIYTWPDLIEGGASDSLSDVALVDITLQRQSDGLYWNGTDWQAGVVWLTTDGTLNWQYALPIAILTDGETYTVRSRATDYAGNVETTWGSSEFTYAGSGPNFPVVSSTTHPVPTAWYNANDPAFAWTVPESSVEVVGYSFSLDQTPTTLPDAVADTPMTSTTYLDVADGTWYFHVRAVDSSGNWGPAGHFRIAIDTATPNAPVSVTDETPDVDWDADGSLTVYWTGVANTGSGIAYTVERCVDGGLTGVCTTSWSEIGTAVTVTHFADSVGATDGTTVRYRVRAVNGVGLSGAWTESDGLTVDSETPATPAPAVEGDPTPDITHDADGNFTVYWTAVANTGSGLTYRLERQVNGGGYSLVAEGLTGTSYAVSGSYGDGDVVQYRVIAISGVAIASAPAESTGVIIDSQTPAAPASVTEGSPDVDWDADGNVTVYWTAVPDTGSGLVYRLERRINTGNWTVVSGAEVLTVTEYAVSGAYNNGDFIEFRVRATNGVGLVGPWAQSDGVTVDNAAPVAPGNVTENTPDVDFLTDVNGALTVYWGAVPNTGSGITYRVERRVDGGDWVIVATDVAATSLADSGGPYADDTFIEYRVTAVTGLGLDGEPGYSDGVRIDLDTPAAPGNVGEGDVIGTDDDYDENNLFYVFWDVVAPTATGDSVHYIVERSRNGGAWEQATTTTATSWDDPVPYSGGDAVSYRVFAVNGAGVTSAASAASDGILLDFVRPDSAVETNGFYNNFTWPGAILGTAVDDVSDVALVEITLRRQSDSLYWDGATWSATAVWLATTGTTEWQYAFAPADGETYDVRSRATDRAGNVETSLGSSTFNYAASGPAAPAISSTTHPDQALWYNANDPVLEWTTPASGSGISGYSYLLDQVADTEPDLFADTGGHSRSCNNLADGVWYFHVRALDNAGNWGPAGHFRLAIDTTAPAAPGVVTEESPDVDWDADGNLTVIWEAVNDLSGVTYTVERSSDNGLTWEGIASGITTTTALDPITHPDGAILRYRVQATDAVALSGGWTQSDGVTVDSETPAQPTGVGEGDIVGTDDTWDENDTFFVFWDAVANTGSGIRYTVERSINGGAWEVAVSDFTQTFWEDPQSFVDGDTVAYRVTAVNGVNTVGAASEASNGVTLDFTRPDSVVETAGTYGSASWPGQLNGTASDATSGVAIVHIALQRASDSMYWNGGGWAATATWLATTGGDAWTYAFTPENGESYLVQSRATDAAGNREVSYGTGEFTYTTSEPESVIETGGLYIGAAWSGAIRGTAHAPMAAVDYVELTIQRAADGLYFNGVDWSADPTWLRATGAAIWSYVFTPVDGATYTVVSRATDATGNIQMTLATATFSYDAAAPALIAVDVTSDSAYFYTAGLTTNGGTAYFNSVPGQGAGQTLTVTTTFDEPNPASLTSGTAFGAASTVDTESPWQATYTVEAYSGSQNGVLFTVADTLGLTDSASVTFIQDNLAPESEANIADEATNVAPFAITWTAGDDASGVKEVRLWVKYQPIGTWTDTGMVQTGTSGSFIYTPLSGDGTYYFATVAVDNVNNVQPAPTGFGDDQIDYDGAAPTSVLEGPAYTADAPIAITWQAAFDAKYTYLYYRYGAAGEWADVAFSTEKSGVFEFAPADGDGYYYFATVAIDEAGNAEPIATDGKALVIYDTKVPSSTAIVSTDFNTVEQDVFFVVSWVGEDGALGSGIAAYDVDIKQNDGEWTRWLTQTTALTATYTARYYGADSATFYFRSRAIDRAGNLEAWPNDPHGDGSLLVFWGDFVGRYRAYLPYINRGFTPVIELPDLVVTALEVVPAAPQVGETVDLAITIKNQGNRAATRDLWIDLYINPSRTPQVNDMWQDIAEGGVVWLLKEDLDPGESITLHFSDAKADYSSFKGAFLEPKTYSLYVQVDSYNEETTYGAVYESNEGNNVLGPSVVEVTGDASISVQEATLFVPLPRPDIW